MTKRARYDGQYEVDVALDSANVYTKFVKVKPGGLLPTETEDGDPVPASLRDDLIQNHPDFSEHPQPKRRRRARPKQPARRPPPEQPGPSEVQQSDSKSDSEKKGDDE